MSKRNAPIRELIAVVAKNVDCELTYFIHDEKKNILIFQPRWQDTGPDEGLVDLFIRKLEQTAEFLEFTDIFTVTSIKDEFPVLSTNDFQDNTVFKIRVEITYS